MCKGYIRALKETSKCSQDLACTISKQFNGYEEPLWNMDICTKARKLKISVSLQYK